jgi:hypothetical protein
MLETEKLNYVHAPFANSEEYKQRLKWVKRGTLWTKQQKVNLNRAKEEVSRNQPYFSTTQQSRPPIVM